MPSMPPGLPPIRDDMGVAGFRLGRGYARRHDDLRRPAEGHDPATRAGARHDERRQVRGPGPSARCAAGLRRARHHAVASRCGSDSVSAVPPSSRRGPRGARPEPQVAAQAASRAGHRRRSSPAAGPHASRSAPRTGRSARASRQSPSRRSTCRSAPMRNIRHSVWSCGGRDAGADRPGLVQTSRPRDRTDGLLPKVMSTARGAWAVTASASDALLAHVVPQIP